MDLYGVLRFSLVIFVGKVLFTLSHYEEMSAGHKNLRWSCGGITASVGGDVLATLFMGKLVAFYVMKYGRMYGDDCIAGSY